MLQAPSLSSRIRKFRKNPSGFSLVELMVALTLGLMVMATVLVVVQSSRSLSTQLDQMAAMQENARAALDLMTQDLRNTGHLPMRHLKKAFREAMWLNVSNVPSTLSNLPFAGLAGTSPQSSAPLNSDTLTLALTEPCWLRSTTDQDRAESPINYINPMKCSTPDKGDFWVIEDVAGATLFRVSQAQDGQLMHEKPQNAQSHLSHAYSAGAWLAQWHVPTYQLRKSTRSGRTELITVDAMSGHTNIIAEGIIALRFRYGLDEDGDGVPDRYRVARQISAMAWGQVKSVEISLLMEETTPTGASQKQVIQFPSAFDGLDESIPAETGRLRKVFRRTVMLRQ